MRGKNLWGLWVGIYYERESFFFPFSYLCGEVFILLSWGWLRESESKGSNGRERCIYMFPFCGEVFYPLFVGMDKRE